MTRACFDLPSYSQTLGKFHAVPAGTGDAEGAACLPYAAPLPRHVIETFEQYLTCGDLARGFVRCHCDGCGHDVLVAFSCKHRGVCPSCGARRMAADAAQVVDRVVS